MDDLQYECMTDADLVTGTVRVTDTMKEAMVCRTPCHADVCNDLSLSITSSSPTWMMMTLHIFNISYSMLTELFGFLAFPKQPNQHYLSGQSVVHNNF